jgi:hypothetical protein
MEATVTDHIVLTPQAFRRFWFRYCEMNEDRMRQYAETDPEVEAALSGTLAEIEEYWPMLVEECNAP